MPHQLQAFAPQFVDVAEQFAQQAQDGPPPAENWPTAVPQAPGPSPDSGGNPILAPIDPLQQHLVEEAQTSAELDGLEAFVPGLSLKMTGVSAVKTVGDLLDGDTEDAKKDASDTLLNGIGCVPGVGNLLSVEEMMWDSQAADERKYANKSADDAPTFSEAFYKGLPSWKDITSPFTDPESWTPQGPSGE